MTLFDRLLIRNYIKAYIYCLISILSLYIVVDLFTHIDDFAEHHSGLNAILKHVGSYYGVMMAQYFDRLCEVIALMAGAFTVAWIQRHNELMPLLSAGMRTQRVVMPVLVAACVMLKPGKALSGDELIDHCRRSLANYKVPRRIEFSDAELPKNGAGKILKRALRERFWDHQERAVS